VALKTLVRLGCSVAGTTLYLLFALLHLTCRFVFEGAEHLPARTPVILCFWHEHSVAYFVTFLRHDRRHAWISDPSLRMRPIHVGMMLSGISTIVMGSSGHNGIQAAQQLVAYLNQGYSTGISPDGPAGPPRVLHKGVLHIAAESSVPIVPLGLSASRRFVTRSWDRKWIPMPFSTVTVRYAPPIHVDEANFDEMLERLSDALR